MTDFHIGDLHLGHRNIIKFANSEGVRHRPFATIEDHNEHVINSINSVVKKNDKLYLYGDIVFGTKNFEYLKRINCQTMYLISGNHDNYSSHTYLEYFQRIMGQVQYKNNIVQSHMPCHPMEVGVGNRYRLNIHGHTHSKTVKLISMNIDDPNYLCVSCEQLNYIPISYEEILEKKSYLFG